MITNPQVVEFKNTIKSLRKAEPDFCKFIDDISKKLRLQSGASDLVLMEAHHLFHNARTYVAPVTSQSKPTQKHERELKKVRESVNIISNAINENTPTWGLIRKAIQTIHNQNNRSLSSLSNTANKNLLEFSKIIETAIESIPKGGNRKKYGVKPRVPLGLVANALHIHDIFPTSKRISQYDTVKGFIGLFGYSVTEDAKADKAKKQNTISDATLRDSIAEIRKHMAPSKA